MELAKIIDNHALGRNRVHVTFAIGALVFVATVNHEQNKVAELHRQDGQNFTSISTTTERFERVTKTLLFTLRLMSVLDIAAATVELNTGNGAQTNPAGWPRTTNMDIDHDAVAKLVRGVLKEIQS